MSTAVAVVALVAAALLSVAAAGLLLQARALRARAEVLESRIDALVPGPPVPPDLAATLGTGQRRVLAVEILNPVELAASKIPAARLLGAVRPALLTKVVYDQAAKQVVDQLELEGVLADVQVHAAR
ncbi:MAG TPA: hypothetical protein VFK41_03190 [Nocardioidaceae bacterium]|nr:hypothetical protein [Nocardioidaceae bacterium]